MLFQAVSNLLQRKVAVEVDPFLAAALKVADEINEWFGNQELGGTRPEANLLVGESVLELHIGETCVWSSEEHGLPELDRDYLLAIYRRELLDHLVAFKGAGKQRVLEEAIVQHDIAEAAEEAAELDSAEKEDQAVQFKKFSPPPEFQAKETGRFSSAKPPLEQPPSNAEHEAE